MKTVSVIFSLLLITALLGAAGIYEPVLPIQTNQVTTGDNQEFFTQSVQQFSDQLFFVESYAEKNVMLSPLSVLLALGMTTNGADGETLSSMLHVLTSKKGTLQQFNEANEHYLNSIRKLSDVELSIANSLWLNKEMSFDKAFLSKTKDVYHASAKSLDFSARRALTSINSWVSDATRGTIKTILDSLNPEALMYLINAVYFKGDWKIPFTKESTYKENFFTEDMVVSAPFMHQTAHLPYAKALDAQILMMNYTNERFALVAILPSEFTDLGSWLANQKEQGGFTQRMFAAVESLQSNSMELSLPTFEASYTKSLVDDLKQLGMSDPFDASKADFSLMSESRGKDLVIGEVLHKSFIRVDEKGSEAAAVTSIMMKATSMPYREELQLSFDRPFFYAIIDKQAKIPLFMGILANPLGT
ncbi:MAG TPA: serpin family protein [Sphaerochaeta sp.]|nr:serpin family protein [Sphaerochaeta sp.]